METVLAVYRRASDPAYPVVRMDETSVQCAREARDPIPAKPGQSERYDVEYERNGVAHLLAFYAPFESWRRIDIADNHAAEQWAQGVQQLVQENYPQATRITLVMDNLNTHGGASLYKAFPPHVARSLLDKLACVYTPKHGSWLNLAECEFSVLGRQCLDRRLPDLATVASEVPAWTETWNQSNQPVDWRPRKTHGSSSNAFILYYQVDELLGGILNRQPESVRETPRHDLLWRRTSVLTQPTRGLPAVLPVHAGLALRVGCASRAREHFGVVVNFKLVECRAPRARARRHSAIS